MVKLLEKLETVVSLMINQNELLKKIKENLDYNNKLTESMYLSIDAKGNDSQLGREHIKNQIETLQQMLKSGKQNNKEELEKFLSNTLNTIAL